MKILVFGSRHWKDYGKILNTINKFHHDYFDDLIIIQGGCKGADELAKEACKTLNVDYEEYPADWNKYGLRAGR